MKQHRTASKTIHAGSAAGTLFLFAVLTVTSSHALPQSGTVVAGSATISQPSSTSLNIVQSSGNAIINWQGYNIGAAESVTYVQPNSNSIVLNRVTGVDPTSIFGRLSGNGQVWVINPNGLLVGSGATVQTGGFLASTMNISNDSFMSGKYVFTNTPGSQTSIVNEGAIQAADGGYVLLSAPSVINSGSIIANKGNVHLASGDVITFSIDNGSLINVAVSGDVAAEARGITNNGKITADGGQVVLTARVAGDALRNVVNNAGLIEAHSIIEKDGIIILDGGDHGITANSGTVDASGKNTGETGGSVTILGTKVGLFAGSLVDVSGDAGGGTALIGGNFHGGGPEKNAAMTYVDKDAVVIADALESGNGGSVAVWSDVATRYFGTISAKGGVQGGDGGFIEVSGKHSLTYAGLANLEAPRGATGTLLLDPDEITIIHGSSDTNITVTGAGPFADSSSGSGSTLSDGTINTQLGTANVTITTSTDSITSNADVVIDTNSKTLTLDSARDITLGGTFNDAGSLGTLNLKIGQTGTGGTMAFSSGAVIKTHTVSITGGSGNDTLTGQNAANTWNITSPNTVTLNGMNATGIESLVGGSASDTFSLGSGVSTFNGSISGGSGANSLAATNGVNTWQLSAANSGTLNSTTAFSGISTLAGGSGTDTLVCSAQTYLLDNTVTNKGSNGLVTGWTAIENLTDTGAGIFKFGTAGGVTGSILALNGTLDYSGHTAAANVNLAGTGTTGIGGSWSGITSVIGSATTTDTITGANQTYSLDNSIANKGSNGSVTWSAMENLTDTGTGTFNMGTGGSVSGNINGGASGTLNYSAYGGSVTLNLAGTGTTGIGGTWSKITAVTGNSVNSNTVTGASKTYTLNSIDPNKGSAATATGTVTWTDFKNITDTGSGIFNMGSSGIITGNINGGTGGTLDFSSYTSPVTLDLGGSGTTGISGTWSGIATVKGNTANSNMVTGLNRTYTLNNSTANKGSDGTVTWTAFKNITDTGSGTFNMGTGGSITGDLNGGTDGTLNYGSYGNNVVLNLSGTGTTGIGGGWSGITTVNGNSASANTITGLNKTYHLDNSSANSGSDGTVTWTAFKNITDSGTGTFNMGTGGSVTGNLNGGTNGTVNFSSYGSNVTLNLSGTGTTGVGGTLSGIASVIGNAANANTITGMNSTYILDNSITNRGSSSNIAWTAFRNITDTGTGTFNMGTGGNVTGSLNGGTSGTLNYAGYATPVVLNLAGTGTTGIGGTWSGITTVTGNTVNSNTVIGLNKNYHLDNLSANKGSDGAVTWTAFKNITDTGSGIFNMNTSGSVTGNLSGGTNGTLNYGSYGSNVRLNLSGNGTTGIGGTWSGITTVTGNAANSNTVTGLNKTYILDDSIANKGSAGPVTWTSFKNITDTSTGIFNMGIGGGITGNLNGGISGTLNYGSYGSNVTLDLSGTGTTGIGGTWSNITTITGNAVNSNTITGANKTYSLDNSIANKGSAGPVTWTAFNSITDTGTGMFNMGTGGNVTGNLNGGIGGTLDYGRYGSNVTVNLSGGGSTGIGGTWSGIATVTGNAAHTNTISGLHRTYNLSDVAIGNSGGVFWSAFERIADTGTGTLSTSGGQTFTLTGPDSGSVTSLLPGGFTGIGNLADTGAATFRFGANGGVSSSISAVNGALDYSAGITGPVAVDLTAKTGTGIGTNWSGVKTIIGSPASDTMSGTNATYNLTPANTGNSAGVSWTSFENLQDSGAGIFRFGANASITGNISALSGTLDYSAGITGPVAVNLTAKTGTGIGGHWDGIAAITGSSAPDAMGGTDATYHLTAADAGNSDGVSWTSFEKIADTSLGTVMTTGGQAYALTGNNSGTVAALLPGGFSGIGNLTDSGAGSFKFGANGSISGSISALSGQLDYSEVAGPVSVDLAAQTATGVGGTWSGIATITGSGASDTLTSSGATYHLTADNAGNSGETSWTSFENLHDTGAGTFGFTSGGSVTGNITAVDGTLDYSARSGAVTINLLTQKGSGIGGTWSGITSLTGSSASDTIASTGATYNLTDASAGNSGAISWSSFEKIADAGTGTITTGGGQTYTLTGTNSGNVAALLPDGFTGIGNLTDFDAGIFRFGANGSITGSITAVNGTLDYSAGITGPILLDLTAQTSTGIGGTWSGISAVTGSSHTSDTITGISQAFTLTGDDAGNNGSVSWSSLENITGSGTNSYIGAGGSLSGSIIDTGSSTTLQGSIQTGDDQIYTGAVTLAGATTLTSTGSGTITFAGTLDSDATPRDLTIGTYGATTFGGLVGASPLNSLTINAGGSTAINGGSITTSGAAGQVYSNDVVLGADTALNSGSGVIAFSGSLDGAHALTLSAGAGDISLSGATGAVTRLNGFTITSAGNVAIATVAAASLTQTAGNGSTTLNGAVDTTGVTITTNGSITNNGAIFTTGDGPVILTAGNYIRINNAISSSGPITLSAGRAITEGSSGSLATTALLTTRSSDGQALDGNGSNTVATINAVNSGSGDITLTSNAAPLTITGLTQSGGNLVITNSGEITSSAPLTVTGTTTITASGQPITLTNSNDFTGVVTVAGGATRITDVNNLSVALNTTGPTVLLAGTNMTVSGISTDTVTATAPNQVTLANPAASLLTITGNIITGTMNNSSPLYLTTTTAQTSVSVALTGNQPFLNFVGDTTSNIRGLGTYNGTVVVGSELENYKATIGMRAATVASATNSATMDKWSRQSRFDDYFTIASRASIINAEEAVRSPELDPILIDR